MTFFGLFSAKIPFFETVDTIEENANRPPYGDNYFPTINNMLK